MSTDTPIRVVNINYQDRPFTLLPPLPIGEPVEATVGDAPQLKQRASALTAREIAQFETLMQDVLSVKAKAFDPRYSSLALRVTVELIEKRMPRSITSFGHVIKVAPYSCGYTTMREEFLAAPSQNIERITSGLIHGVERVEEVALAEAISVARKEGKIATTPNMPLCQESFDKALKQLKEQGIDADMLIIPQTLADPGALLSDQVKSVIVLDGLADVAVQCTTCKTPIEHNPGEPQTWYLAQRCRGDKFAFITATEKGFEFLTNIAPSDLTVFFQNKFGFAVQQWAGAVVAEPSLVACFTP
jgi:hypothetical protein